jgi:hypothetical protein
VSQLMPPVKTRSARQALNSVAAKKTACGQCDVYHPRSMAKNVGASVALLSWVFCYANMHRFCGLVFSATQVRTSELMLGSMSVGSS